MRGEGPGTGRRDWERRDRDRDREWQCREQRGRDRGTAGSAIAASGKAGLGKAGSGSNGIGEQRDRERRDAVERACGVGKGGRRGSKRDAGEEWERIGEGGSEIGSRERQVNGAYRWRCGRTDNPNVSASSSCPIHISARILWRRCHTDIGLSWSLTLKEQLQGK
ncbi:uncharacterized protein LOC120499542 isoform X2 [Passer montanus]|uniref:uncharacterized protein LOC120499542 isoform X2 n=1 Tax=Passer montanus TaxID=9160 RepID=UPI001961BB1E|nr:uncharacterized protein LOC120499542 isoform X2 [Passer montanus]